MVDIYSSKEYLNIFEKTLYQLDNYIKNYENQDELLNNMILKYKDLRLNDPFIDKLLVILEKQI